MWNFLTHPPTEEILAQAGRIKLVLTDCDGVLTDNGAYYTENGEITKRFSVRDGMGVERFRNLTGGDVGIVSGEQTGSLRKRAERLKITELHTGILDKRATFLSIFERTKLSPSEIAFIGDDYNDLEALAMIGISACPADALPEVRRSVNYICAVNGGYGAFREFVELIIYAYGRIKEK